MKSPRVRYALLACGILATGIACVESVHVCCSNLDEGGGDWQSEYDDGSRAFEARDYPRAQSDWQIALRTAEASSDHGRIVASLEALARVSRQLEDIDGAIQYYAKRLLVSRPDVSTQDYVHLLSRTAKRYEELGRHEDALALLFEARGRIGSLFKNGPAVASADRRGRGP
jgi:tetratricopeptide (TPR) repeat protein